MKKLSPAFNAVTVARREVFQIELKGIPAAGFIWALDIQDGEGRVLSQQSKGPQDPQLTGGEVTQIFSLIAEKKGQLRVVATYARPWETKPAMTETFTITVK